MDKEYLVSEILAELYRYGRWDGHNALFRWLTEKFGVGAGEADSAIALAYERSGYYLYHTDEDPEANTIMPPGTRYRVSDGYGGYREIWEP